MQGPCPPPPRREITRAVPARPLCCGQGRGSLGQASDHEEVNVSVRPFQTHESLALGRCPSCGSCPLPGFPAALYFFPFVYLPIHSVMAVPCAASFSPFRVPSVDDCSLGALVPTCVHLLVAILFAKHAHCRLSPIKCRNKLTCFSIHERFAGSVDVSQEASLSRLVCSREPRKHKSARVFTCLS